MAKPRFSHLRAGDLATFHRSGHDVPVKVIDITDGNTALVEVTAARPAANVLKGQSLGVTDNLTSQRLTSRTASATTLLVFSDPKRNRDALLTQITTEDAPLLNRLA